MIPISYVESVDSRKASFSANRFCYTIPSISNLAISMRGAHLDESNSGSADALFRNCGMLSEFLYSVGCVMSYVKV